MHIFSWISHSCSLDGSFWSPYPFDELHSWIELLFCHCHHPSFSWDYRYCIRRHCFYLHISAHHGYRMGKFYVFCSLARVFTNVLQLPVPWFYPSEISTTRTRTKMQAIASGWNWMFVFTVVKITPISFGKSMLQI